MRSIEYCRVLASLIERCCNLIQHLLIGTISGMCSTNVFFYHGRFYYLCSFGVTIDDIVLINGLGIIVYTYHLTDITLIKYKIKNYHALHIDCVSNIGHSVWYPEIVLKQFAKLMDVSALQCHHSFQWVLCRMWCLQCTILSC